MDKLLNLKVCREQNSEGKSVSSLVRMFRSVAFFDSIINAYIIEIHINKSMTRSWRHRKWRKSAKRTGSAHRTAKSRTIYTENVQKHKDLPLFPTNHRNVNSERSRESKRKRAKASKKQKNILYAFDFKLYLHNKHFRLFQKRIKELHTSSKEWLKLNFFPS